MKNTIGGFYIMAGKKGMRHCPIEIRKMIVAERQSGSTMKELCEKYQVIERQIRKWCEWTREYGIPKQLTGKRRGRQKAGEEAAEQKIKRLEMENALLKKFHELLREEHKRK